MKQIRRVFPLHILSSGHDNSGNKPGLWVGTQPMRPPQTAERAQSNRPLGLSNTLSLTSHLWCTPALPVLNSKVLAGNFEDHLSNEDTILKWSQGLGLLRRQCLRVGSPSSLLLSSVVYSIQNFDWVTHTHFVINTFSLIP